MITDRTETKRNAKLIKKIETAYDAEDVPLPSYATLLAAYAAIFTLLHLLTRSRETDPKKLKAIELAYLTIGSYKLSRVITMSFIASFLRAPFTTRGKSLKGGEVQDVARGEGLQKAIGNMLTCPFCFNVWASTFFIFGHRLAPQMAIRFAQVLAVSAVSDALHLSYQKLREKEI